MSTTHWVVVIMFMKCPLELVTSPFIEISCFLGSKYKLKMDSQVAIPKADTVPWQPLCLQINLVKTQILKLLINLLCTSFDNCSQDKTGQEKIEQTILQASKSRLSQVQVLWTWAAQLNSTNLTMADILPQQSKTQIIKKGKNHSENTTTPGRKHKRRNRRKKPVAGHPCPKPVTQDV